MRRRKSFLIVFAIIFFIPSPCLLAAPVTWSRDVAPILYRHCSACHRPGQPAPFPLLTYDDAKRHALSIARVTQSRYMPPWMPVHGYGAFAGERRLTTFQIAVIQSWVRAGAPEGNSRIAPPVPFFPSGWHLGPPDALIGLPHPFTVPADGPDLYRCFVLPAAIDRDRYVRAFEFDPGPTQALHHALIFVDGRQRSTAPGNQALPDGYDCFGTPGFFPTAALGGWTPGNIPKPMPPGTATHLPRGARFVIQLHFHPTGKVEIVDPRIALYFADTPPSRFVMDVPLGSNRIDIPAGARHYRITDHFEIPVPVQVVGVIPHAHYLCRGMKAWAILPGGGKRWLLSIADWNFNWQDQYRYAQPFELPAGTEVSMEFTYDNSAANVRNPNHPARRVTWGPGSTDEMAGLHLQVIPRNDTEMHELGMALWGKVMRGVGGSFYRPPDPQ